MTKWKGLKRKAEEISLLCGVHLLVASRSPEFNILEFWPEMDMPEFHRIRERYLCLHKKRNNSYDNGEQIPCLPMSSSSFSTMLFHEEMVAMEIKLEDIRDRLHFLQADSHNDNSASKVRGEEELHLAQFTISTPLQQDSLSYDQSSDLQQDPLSYDQSSEFSHSLPADFDNFNMFLQQDDLLVINLEQISSTAPPLPPNDQPIPPLADFNMCFHQDIHHPLTQPSLFPQSNPPTDQYYHASLNMHLQHGATSEYEYVGIFMIAFAASIFLFLGSVEGFSSKEQPCPYIKDKTCKTALSNAILSTIDFLLGAVTLVASGFLGMKIETFANARTTLEARKGVGKAFSTAFRSGSVMGTLLAANGLFV